MNTFFKKKYKSVSDPGTQRLTREIPLDRAHHRRRVSPLTAITRQYHRTSVEVSRDRCDSSETDNESIAAARTTFGQNELLSECVHLKPQKAESSTRRSLHERSLPPLGSVSSLHSKISLNHSNSNLVVSSRSSKLDPDGKGELGEYISYIDRKISRRRNSIRTVSTFASHDSNDWSMLGSFPKEIDSTTNDDSFGQLPRNIQVDSTHPQNSFSDSLSSFNSSSLSSAMCCDSFSASSNKEQTLGSLGKVKSTETPKCKPSKRVPKCLSEAGKIDNLSCALSLAEF